MACRRLSDKDLELFHRIKSDLKYFKQVLKITSEKTSGRYLACPFCGSKHSFQFGPDLKYTDEYFFSCDTCGSRGDVIEALCLTGLSWEEAWKKVCSDLRRSEQEKPVVLWPIF